MGLREIVINMDEDVQRFYTKVGRRIPEKHLYKLTLSLGVFGGSTGFLGINDLYSLSGVLGYGGAVFTGLNGNLDCISMIVSRDTHGGAAAYHDAFVDSLRSINKKTRFPIFLAGAAYAGKFFYDIANYFLNGEQLSSDSFLCLQTGAGLLGLSSSMYLKDQDPKLLERETVEERVSKLFPIYARK